MSSQWSYLIADLRTQAILAELPLTGVKMSKVLNGSGQLAASVPADRALAARVNLYDLTRPVRRCVYAYRDGRPWWGGIIWASDYQASTGQITLGCADFWSYFDHRKVLPVLTLPAAATYVAGLSTVYGSTDQNDIARGLVTAAQAHTGGNIGIVVDATTSGITRDRTYRGFDMVDVGEALRDLAGLSDGCDVAFDLGPLDSSGRPVRMMRTGTPSLGQSGSDHRFDLGGNLLDFKWTSGGGVMATRTFAEGAGVDTGAQIAVGEDATRYDFGWPLLETDDVFSDVSVFATLQGHADTLLSGLRLPVVIPELTIIADQAPSLGELGVGDDARLIVPEGDLLFPDGRDVPVRILAINVDVDEQGKEDVVLACQAIEDTS